MIKSNSKIFYITALLLFGTVLLMPETAYAANVGIFDTIFSKIVATLRDLRKIVYVVAGFGLIMFAVLAIFNKISFKHLMYICVSLFLLANMFNFINYFSGAGLSDNTSQQVWGDNLKTNDKSLAGSDVNEGKKCEGQSCPDGGNESGGSTSGAGSIAGGSTSGADGSRVGVSDSMPNISGIGNISAPSSISNPLAAQDEALKAKAQACVAAGNKWNSAKQKCVKSWGNAIRDIAKGAQQAASAVGSAANTVRGAKDVYGAVRDAPDNIKSAIDNIGKGHGLDEALHNIAGAANTIGSASGRISSSVSSTVGSAESGMRSTGDLASTITGNRDNSFSQGMSNSPVVDALEAVKQTTGDVNSGVNSTTSAVSSTANSGSSILNNGERLGHELGF